MQRIKLPQIQGHYLTLTLKESSLKLEIEEESSGRTFSLDLEEDSIVQVTDHLYQATEDLFRGLQDAANQACPGITLGISKGKLIYTVVFSIETAQQYSFILNLTEKRMDQVEVLERKVRLLEQWKEKYEAEIKELKNACQSLKIDQRLGELEKLEANRKESIPSEPDVIFNNASVNSPHFEFSDNNKTAKSIFGTYACLEILPQIPLSGKHSYSLRINNDSKKRICFGITTKTGNTYWNENQYNYRFCTSDGKIYGRASQQPIEDSLFGGKDTIIKMIVDMDQGTLTFFVDERLVNSCHISKTDKYFAEISLGYAGDSVTLL